MKVNNIYDEHRMDLYFRKHVNMKVHMYTKHRMVIIYCIWLCMVVIVFSRELGRNSSHVVHQHTFSLLSSAVG